MKRLCSAAFNMQNAVLAMSLRLFQKQLAYSSLEETRCIATTPVTNEWHKARPLHECPQVTLWEMLSGFMPRGRFYNKGMDEFLRMEFKEKGDILQFGSFLGSAPKVMSQNPDDFEKIFRHDGPWPQRAGFELLNYHRTQHRKQFFGQNSGLLTTQGKEWADFRTAVNPILMQPKNVKIYIPNLSKVSEQFIARIRAIRDSHSHEVPANFQEEISRWTLESICLVALDKQLQLFERTNTETERFMQNMRTFFDLSIALEMQPSAWRILATPKFKQIMRTLDDMLDITQNYVNAAVECAEQATIQKPPDEQSVLEKLLKIDKRIATVMALDMLFAGVDTTMSTFVGLLLCLAKNAEKQQKLREEIISALPAQHSPLTMENMQQLRYLRACIKEALRYYPLSIGTSRTIQQDLVLSGYRVPAGTEVIIVNMNLLRDEKHFSQPNEFIPERWLRNEHGSEDRSKGVMRVAATPEECAHKQHMLAIRNSHPFAYLPFGFGPRSCIGRRIAELLLEIGAARIIRNFNVEFEYSTENAFKSLQIYMPNIPLKFKFTDLSN